METKEEYIYHLEVLQRIYQELYENYDPDGEIAVHIEYDLFLSDVIELFKRHVCDFSKDLHDIETKRIKIRNLEDLNHE